MDARHAAMMERVGEGILAAAEAQEKRLDAQLKGLENLGETDSIVCERYLWIVFEYLVCICAGALMGMQTRMILRLSDKSVGCNSKSRCVRNRTGGSWDMDGEIARAVD
jgi:hypothetical protein